MVKRAGLPTPRCGSSGIYAVIFLAGSATTDAGVEPSPFLPEINKIHSIELNKAAI